MTLPDKTEILRKVTEKGGYLISSFLNPSRLNLLLEEFDGVFCKIPDKAHAVVGEGSNPVVDKLTYSSGKHLRVTPNQYLHFPELLEVIKSPYLMSLAANYLGDLMNYTMQVFMSHEYNVILKEDLVNVRSNSHLHWDPYHSLKFMLYLTDVDERNGATCYVPGTRSLGQEYRESRMDITSTLGLEGGVPNRLKDYEKYPKYSEEDAIPVVAKAGDLLVFDTDALHCGGNIQEAGLERKIILLHNRR